MALQHSTEYSLSTVSDSGPWDAWVQQPEHAAEDVGDHSMTIPGLPVGLYWARLRITSLPLTENSTIVISEVFSFEVVNAAVYLAQLQQMQTASAAGGVSYPAISAASQKLQTGSSAGSISFGATVESIQSLQTEQILPLTNDKIGAVAETQAAQTQANTAAVLVYSTLAGAQKLQTEAVAVTYSVASDTTAPTVTAFTAGTPTGSSVPITSFTATDAVGVTGYLITESATTPSAGAAGWTGTAPSTYTAVGTGALTLRAWAKDAAGNVSAALTADVTITSVIYSFAGIAGTDVETYNSAFTRSVAGSGTVQLDGAGAVRIYTSAASSAALLTRTAAISRATPFSIKIRIKHVSAATFIDTFRIQTYDAAAKVAVGTNAAFAAAAPFRILSEFTQGSAALRFAFYYKNAAGTLRGYKSGVGWQNYVGNEATQIVWDTYYIWVMESDGTQVRWLLRDGGDTSSVLETPWVQWSDVFPITDSEWLAVGDWANDFHRVNSYIDSWTEE